MKRARIAVIALALLCLITSGVAQASTPSSGTLSSKVRTLKWTGTLTASEPTPMSGCNLPDPDPICDHFALKIDLPDGVRIRIDLKVPNAVTDLDLRVVSSDGAEVASSGNLPGENERVDFTHRGRQRNKPYDVQVVPYLVAPGTTYSAIATVR